MKNFIKKCYNSKTIALFITRMYRKGATRPITFSHMNPNQIFLSSNQRTAYGRQLSIFLINTSCCIYHAEMVTISIRDAIIKEKYRCMFLRPTKNRSIHLSFWWGSREEASSHSFLLPSLPFSVPPCSIPSN